MRNLFILSFLSILFFSCNKLDQSTLVGTWKMVEFKANGNNQMPSYVVTIEFQSANTHITYGDGAVIYSGVYSLNIADQKLTIDNVTYEITHYQGNQMTLETSVGGTNLVYKYEKQ
ncbi:MAG: lipocalin family protein [Crocinitomicaceae bacterium]